MQTVIFDLDDTLIHCNKYFNESLAQFANWMVERFDHVTKEEVLKKQLQFDLAGVKDQGFAKERYPASLVETYEYFSSLSGRVALDAEKSMLRELGHDVYDQQYEPYPHMEETLNSITRDGHQLCLFTGGDASVQHVKVEQLGLRKYFGNRIFIAKHKNTDSMKSVLKELESSPKHTWMIGNSARTDIIPALENGIHAIFIPNEQEWEYNQVEINVKPSGVFVQLKALKDVPETINHYAELISSE